MTLGKGTTRAGLQILFECCRAILILEGNIGHQSPRTVFRSMWGSTGVVVGHSFLEILGNANITTARIILTF